MDILQERISGIEISPNEKSKRIINIKINHHGSINIVAAPNMPVVNATERIDNIIFLLLFYLSIIICLHI